MAVNALLFQPIINYLAGHWYIGIGDFTWQFDWTDSGTATIPLGLQVGRITRVGGHRFNLWVEIEYSVVHPHAAVFLRWGMRFGLVLLLPE